MATQTQKRIVKVSYKIIKMKLMKNLSTIALLLAGIIRFEKDFRLKIRNKLHRNKSA